VGEDRSSGECLFQVLKSSMTFLRKFPWNVFSSEACKQDCDLQVVLDEVVVKIGKSKGGLNVLDFPWFWPILDSFDLVLCY
jgi:hypothetical protein